MNHAGQRTKFMTKNQQRIERQAAFQVLIDENTSLIVARNGLHATICSILASKGGEVTITPGTMRQLMETRLGFAIVPGPGDGEYTLRLVPEPIEGDVNGDNHDSPDDDQDGSENQATSEGEFDSGA